MRIVPLAFLCILSACAAPFQGPPGQEELATADYGPPPPDNYKELVRDYLDQRIINPIRAKVSISTPVKAWWGAKGGLLVRRDIHYGWRVKARLENGYTHSFYFRDGKIVAAPKMKPKRSKRWVIAQRRIDPTADRVRLDFVNSTETEYMIRTTETSLSDGATISAVIRGEGGVVKEPGEIILSFGRRGDRWSHMRPTAAIEIGDRKIERDIDVTQFGIAGQIIESVWFKIDLAGARSIADGAALSARICTDQFDVPNSFGPLMKELLGTIGKRLFEE